MARGALTITRVHGAAGCVGVLMPGATLRLPVRTHGRLATFTLCHGMLSLGLVVCRYQEIIYVLKHMKESNK